MELTLEDLESSGDDWSPNLLTLDKLGKKAEFSIRFPKRIFYNLSADEIINYSEYQMAYEEDDEVFQRIQEMFLTDPIFEGKKKSINQPKKKIKKTKASIKKAIIEEPNKKNDKGMKGIIIVGIGLVALIIYTYLYFNH